MINQAAVPDAPEGGGRRAQIVDAALHVMAEHGFRGASIKRIAQHAGLKSPALIYWYFKDKQALFEAMLDELAPFLGVVANAEHLLDERPEIVLPQLTNGFLKTVQQPIIGRFVRVLVSEAARHPSVAAFFAHRGPLVALPFLQRYLAPPLALGRPPPHHPPPRPRPS